jgi:hypothetical protein
MRRFVYRFLLFLWLLGVGGAVHADAGSSLPARRAAVEAAVAWLRTLQRSDGSVGTLGTSCEVAWLVALAGQNPDGPEWTPGSRSLMAACADEAPTFLARRDTGRLAKVLRAVVAARAVGAIRFDPRAFAGMDLIAELEARYNPATALYDANFFFRHCLAVLALTEAGRPLPPRVVDGILAQQRPDGSWSWAVDPDPTDGFATPGDIDTTGRSLQALRRAGLPLYHPAYTRALVYIVSQQREDGGWGLMDGPTNTNSTAIAIDTILAAGWDPEGPLFRRNGRTPVEVLLSLQEAGGAFIYRPGAPESRLLATYDAIPTLLQPYPGDEELPLRLYIPSLRLSHPSAHVHAQGGMR